MANFLTVVTGDTDRLDFQLLAYRDGNDLILWDGRRIKTGESLTGNGFTDTQYGQQTEVTQIRDQQKENLRFILHGGGILEWDETTGLISWDADLYISFPSSSAGDNYIEAGDATVAAGEFLVLTLTRSPSASEDVSGTLSAVADGSVGTGDDVFVLGHHSADDGRFYFWDGTSLSDGDRRRLGGVMPGVEFLYKTYGTGDQVHDISASGDYRIGDGSLMVYMNGQKLKASSAYWDGAYPSGSLVGSLDDGDRYVEVNDGSMIGTKVVFLADDQDASEPLYHPAETHTIPYEWPQTNDWIEIFVGLQGEGPSPVDSLGIYPEPGGGPVKGAVRIKAGAGVSLSYDLPNDAVQIDVTATAGVSSLEAAGASEGPQTGALTITGGNKVTLQDSTGDITIDCDINDLADLDDMTSDLSDAIQGAEDAASANPMATVKQINRLIGFDVLRTKTSSVIRLGYGKAVIGGKVYLSDSSTAVVDVGLTDLYSGDSLTASTWHYVYITEGASPGDPPVGVISTTAPVDGVHPSDSDYLFLSSVYVTPSSEFAFFSKTGSRVSLYSQDVSLPAPTTLSLGSQELVTPAPASQHIPDSGVAEVRILVKLHADTAGGIELRYGQDASAHRVHALDLTADRYYSHEFEVGLDDNGAWIWELEDPGGGSAGSFDGFDGVWLTGYVEARYGTNSDLWTS
tara:strand:- start:23 stop:2077 length:2055 start_codon:yes stop_codon:yes gene_type:complete